MEIIIIFKKIADENEQFFIQDSPIHWLHFDGDHFLIFFFNGPALSQGFSTIENPQERAINEPTLCTMKDE